MDELTDSDLILEIERLSQLDGNVLVECIISIYLSELKKRRTKQDHTQQIVQECLGIIRMCTVRNGHNSIENKTLENVRNKIVEYFNISEKNVNDLYADNEQFRDFFSGR